jgi:hypothetical protein
MTTAKVTKQLGLPTISGNTTKGLTATKNLTGNGRAKYRNNGVIVGGNWKVATLGDGMNITVSRLQGKTWKPEGYFMTLHNAFKYLVDQQVRESDLTDLKAVIEKIEKLKADILGIAAE